MEIKTKFNIGEKVFYNLNNILKVVKTNLLSTDEDIFGHCYGESHPKASFPKRAGCV